MESCSDPKNIQELPKSGSPKRHQRSYEGVHKWGYPKIDQNGWFTKENPTKMDDLGVPLFQETSICLRGRFSLRDLYEQCGSEIHSWAKDMKSLERKWGFP